MQAAIRPRDRQRLRGFLTKHAADQVVVKDPRTAFTQKLWREVAAEVGLEIRYVCMLRHPAEVVGSRTTYYASKDPHRAHFYQITNVSLDQCDADQRARDAGVAAFVRALHRSPRGAAPGALAGPTSGSPSTPTSQAAPTIRWNELYLLLRRHVPTWDDMDIPKDLAALAEEVWQTMLVLSAADGVDDDASARMDEHSAAFERLLGDSAAVCRDLISEARASGAAVGARRACGSGAQRRPAAARRGGRS